MNLTPSSVGSRLWSSFVPRDPARGRQWYNRAVIYIPGLDQLGLHLWRRWVLAGRRSEAASRPAGWRLAHGARFRLSMLSIAVLFWWAYAYLFIVSPEDLESEPRWQVVGVMWLGWILLGVLGYVVATAFVDSALLAPDRIGTRKAFRRPRSCSWGEITGVSLSADKDWLVIEREAQRPPLKVSAYFHGLGALDSMLALNVPAVDRSALKALLPA